MQKYIGQHPLNKPQSAANSVVQKKSSAIFLTDNRPVQLMYGGGKKISDPDPKGLEYDKAAMPTTCSLSIIGGDDVEFVSGGGLHAEEKAIQYLQTLVNNGTLTTHGEPHTVVFSVSKSPCSSTSVPQTRTDGNPGCMERLRHLRDNGLVNAATGQTITFHVILAATKPYQPKVKGGKAASKDEYDKFGGDGAGASGAFPMVR